MTLLQYQNDLTRRLIEAGFDEPAFEARQLLQAALGVKAVDLVRRQSDRLEEGQRALLERWAEARLRRVPLAYLSGVKGFYKYDFLVAPGVLIPRPETELVVELAMRAPASVVADYGCGTGCIGLSLMKEWPAARLYAIDLSEVAVDIARKNSEQLEVASRAQIVRASVDQWRAPEPLDLVVANPPYIAVGDTRVDKHVHDYEPHLALYSGPDGLDAMRVWAARAFDSLASGGRFIAEFGAGQSGQVGEIMGKIGFRNIQMAKDLAGLDRAVTCAKL